MIKSFEWRDNDCSADALLNHVWNHMHGQNMDGSRRSFPDDQECGRNWQRLSDAIGTYLHAKEESLPNVRPREM